MHELRKNLRETEEVIRGDTHQAMFESERGDTLMLIILYGDIGIGHEDILHLQLEDTTQISEVNITKRESKRMDVNLLREAIWIIGIIWIIGVIGKKRHKAGRLRIEFHFNIGPGWPERDSRCDLGAHPPTYYPKLSSCRSPFTIFGCKKSSLENVLV